MTDVTQRIECQWCHAQSPASARSCETCGAPLDIKNLVSDSGWREAPRLKDMTEIHFGDSVCQVEGEIVPVADISLAAGDAVFFEHHVLLWKEETVGMSVMSTPGGMKRALGGMPFVVSVANGPGRVAFSRDATGELVVLPLHPSMELDAREHAFLAASHTITYSFVRMKGLTNILHGEPEKNVTSTRPIEVSLERLLHLVERIDENIAVLAETCRPSANDAGQE